MKKMCSVILMLLCLVSVAHAEVYVVLNEDNSIFLVSGKNDTVLDTGQRVVMYNKKMHEFCAELPAHPSYCRLVGDTYVHDSALEPSPKFDSQACEGELYTEFIPTLSAADKTLLKDNDSMLIITRCFDYKNNSSWTTLKTHMKSLKEQGLSDEAINSFKQIVKNNHYDLDGGA